MGEDLKGEHYQIWFPYPHEVYGLMIDTPCQDIELVDTSFACLEGVNVRDLVDSPLFHEDDNLGIRSFSELSCMGRSKWDMRYVYFEGDPIYDTDY
jgi:hypothetical protein